MEEIIKNIYPMNVTLLGAGYDNALEYLKKLIKLDIIEIPSGTKLETWTVPDEWIVRDAWVKDPDGNKIIDYKKDPLSLVVGTKRTHLMVELEELKKHWYYDEDNHNTVPYMFKYYQKETDDRLPGNYPGNEDFWGFCVRKTDVLEEIPEEELDKSTAIKMEGKDYIPRWRDKLKEGTYEVFIDTEYKPGTMKIAVHTIPGDEREILLFAHLDHPYQANDNLSGVACLVDLATRLKSKHTIKIIFCPETIGSIGYALTQDISKVDFVLAVDICGNDNTLALQKSFLPHKLNDIASLALFSQEKDYRKGPFRATIGSDEYIFNDPKFNIPGILLTRYPYPEYHNADDTPDKINYDKIKETQKVIEKIIEYWDKDFIPIRNFKGPLHRSKYDIQSSDPQFNLSWDYFIYGMDGKKSLSELCSMFGLNFEQTYPIIINMVNNDDCSISVSEKGKRKTKR